MSNGSQKAYESARDDMKKRREISEQRKEERKVQRLEKRVSGVGQDLVIPKDASNGLQEVKEEPAIKEAVPENARVPAEILVGDDFDFPVHDVIPRKRRERRQSDRRNY